jgi:hypothetical protein
MTIWGSGHCSIRKRALLITTGSAWTRPMPAGAAEYMNSFLIAQPVKMPK